MTKNDSPAPHLLLDRITGRQLEVLLCICNEMNTKEIAEHLGIGSKTVETHRANLMQRTGAKTIVGLVRAAIRNKVIEA